MTNNYTIDYQGLSLGSHHFSFPFSDDLFAIWDESPIRHGKGMIEIEMERHTNFMELSVDIEGEVELECDRCMDPYGQAIHFDGQTVVKVSNKASSEESDEDIIWIAQSEDKLDLRQWLYESIILSLPLARVHTDIEDCNEEILKYIK